MLIISQRNKTHIIAPAPSLRVFVVVLVTVDNDIDSAFICVYYVFRCKTY